MLPAASTLYVHPTGDLMTKATAGEFADYVEDLSRSTLPPEDTEGVQNDDVSRRLADLEQKMGCVEKRVDDLEKLIMMECTEKEIGCSVFLKIEEFHREKIKEVVENEGRTPEEKERALKALHAWFTAAKKRRMKKIWIHSAMGGVAGVISAIGVGVGIAIAGEVTATITIVSIVGSFIIGGGLAVLLLAGGMWAYVKYRDWKTKPVD